MIRVGLESHIWNKQVPVVAVQIWCLRVKEVAIGSSFSVESIYYVLTGVSNRCPGSVLRIHNAWVDAVLENIHLQKRVRITSLRPHRPARTNNFNPPTPPNKSTHGIYIMGLGCNCYFWVSVRNYRRTACCRVWRHLRGGKLCSSLHKLLYRKRARVFFPFHRVDGAYSRSSGGIWLRCVTNWALNCVYKGNLQPMRISAAREQRCACPACLCR